MNDTDKLFEVYRDLLNASTAMANPSIPMWLMDDLMMARKAWRESFLVRHVKEES